MPSSTYRTLSAIVHKIVFFKPDTILDIGIGMGKWGLLCREYLETWDKRIYPKDWKITIHGVEAWRRYVNLPWISTVYNKVYCDDICLIMHKLPSYDLVIASDVIEHIEKEQAIEVFNWVVKNSKLAVINLPLGEVWLGNRISDNNPYEKHRSVFELDEVIGMVKKLGKEEQHFTWSHGKGPGVLLFIE